MDNNHEGKLEQNEQKDAITTASIETKNMVNKKIKKKKKKQAPKTNNIPQKVMGGESKERAAARAKARKGASGGVFVYQGAGKKHNDDAILSERKCEKQTLDVQWCLARNDHKQEMCQGLVKLWRECTDKWNARDPQLIGTTTKQGKI